MTPPGATPGRPAPWRDRLPPWLVSPRLLLPVSLLVAAVLLGSFASVVQDIVHQGAAGNGATPAPASPGAERM